MIRWTVFDEASRQTLAAEGLPVTLAAASSDDALACALKTEGIAVLPGPTPQTSLLVSVRKNRNPAPAKPAKQVYASGFLGLSDDSEGIEPEADERPWWKRFGK